MGDLMTKTLSRTSRCRKGRSRIAARESKNGESDTSAEEDKPIGVFGGVEWWPAGSPVSIRAEMRRISHESFTLGAGMTF